MAARLDSVAKFVCEAGKWEVTNLQLQKIIYMAQMFYMGQNNCDRLVDASFEAWDYGPVIPALYHRAKAFGSRPVQDIFYSALPFANDSPRRAVLDQVCKSLLPYTPGALVDVTHWEKGAWAKHYVPRVRGIPIPDADICAEYKDRVRKLTPAPA